MEIVTDNGSVNINRVMKHTLHEMNTSYVTTSYNHPQGTFEVEHLPCTLDHVMSKKAGDSLDTRYIYLNQVLAAIRFNINEPTKFSLFYMLCNPDTVLPIDNILKPKRRYLEQELHKIVYNNNTSHL